MRKKRVSITFGLACLLWAGALLVFGAGTSRRAYAQNDEPISDRETKLLDFSDLEYPPLGRTALIQGIVVIRAKLDDKGNVIDTTALSGSEVLAPDCLSNAKKWRFKPNFKKAVIIVYNFRITEGESKSACTHFEVVPPNFATVTACMPKIQ